MNAAGGAPEGLAAYPLGLRFRERAAEIDYQRWRLASAVPFVRMGMASVLLAWLAALGITAIGIPDKFGTFLAWILVVVAPTCAIVIATSYAQSLQRFLMPATALGVMTGGFVAIWLTYGVADVVGSAAGASVITMFFAFTIFRLPPVLATFAVVPFSIFVLVLLTRDFDAGRMTQQEFAAYAILPITSFMAGLLVCLVLEHLTRRAFVSERIIERQQRALLEERAQLSKFLSPEVTRVVRERGIDAALQQQTLELTAVCCDLRGFTRYTERQGAERMAAVLRDYYEVVVEVARGYGATVKDFAGDGVLILVGAPLPRPDHAQTGLDLARDLVRAVQRITRAHGSEGAPLGVGVGIASGLCAVGAIGSQNRLEYTAVGSAVNLAARLCDQSGDGEILISPETCGRVVAQPGWRQQPVALKGFAAPVAVAIESLAA